MRYRRNLLVPAALGLGFGVMLAFFLWQRGQATWHGKKYSKWFAEFRQAKIRYSTLSGPPRPVVGTTKILGGGRYLSDRDAWLRDPASEALRAMGTNILPFLANEIRRKDAVPLRVYQNWFYRLPAPIRRLAPRPPASRDEIRADAVFALTLLKQDAIAAVPTVYQAFANGTPYTRTVFSESLRGLPFDPIAFNLAVESLLQRGEMQEAVKLVGCLGVWRPETMRTLTNAVLSTNAPACISALAQLRHFREYACFVVPAMAAVLTNSNPDIRWTATSVLESYADDAASALPDLVNALNSNDPELRYRAANAIEGLGYNALPAVPALISATDDSNEMVQHVAARVLKKLGDVTP